jgi:5'-phosphate synthase pdxT subunit
MQKKVGILALQGDFEAHAKAVRRAGAEAAEVRTAEELSNVDGLIIPGGESTTMLKLLNETGMKQPVAEFAASKPVFGTCAGAILLAREVTNPLQEALGVVDIAVERNAYGRQLDSRIVHLKPENGGLGTDEVEAVFIRAPIIRKVGPEAKVMLRYNGDPVLVEQGRHMVATFHPELSTDDRVHRAFIEKL